MMKILLRILPVIACVLLVACGENEDQKTQRLIKESSDRYDARKKALFSKVGGVRAVADLMGQNLTIKAQIQLREHPDQVWWCDANVFDLYDERGESWLKLDDGGNCVRLRCSKEQATFLIDHFTSGDFPKWLFIFRLKSISPKSIALKVEQDEPGDEPEIQLDDIHLIEFRGELVALDKSENTNIP